MEKYEIGGKALDKEEFDDDKDKKEIQLIERDLRRDEINYYRRASGFGRQVTSYSYLTS